MKWQKGRLGILLPSLGYCLADTQENRKKRSTYKLMPPSFLRFLPNTNRKTYCTSRHLKRYTNYNCRSPVCIRPLSGYNGRRSFTKETNGYLLLRFLFLPNLSGHGTATK